tara:strand:+ start:126 stop:776 length:651 start_codon:yes stop_codon:yes gene_type:complete
MRRHYGWLPGIEEDFLLQGNGLRTYWYNRVSSVWHADERKERKMGKIWKENPHLMVLELERQYENLDGPPQKYVMESDALGKMTGEKEYGPGKVILCTQQINRFWHSLHLPYIDERGKHRGVQMGREKTKPYRSDPKIDGKRYGIADFPTKEEAAIHFENCQIQFIDLWISRLENEPSKYCGDPEKMIEAFRFEKRRIESWILELSQKVPSLWGAA